MGAAAAVSFKRAGYQVTDKPRIQAGTAESGESACFTAVVRHQRKHVVVPDPRVSRGIETIQVPGVDREPPPLQSRLYVHEFEVQAHTPVEKHPRVAAFDRQLIPPTINLDDPDEACPLNHVAHQARPARIRTALSNSFGFGGSNLALVLKAA